MLTTLAIANYRSIRQIALPLGRLNVVTGANGSGKSNLYRALRLLSDTARGGIVGTLARDGGFDSTLWAGPEKLTRRMKTGAVPVQGGPRQEPVNLRLGFCDDSIGYAIDIGLPIPSAPASNRRSFFGQDPQIKRECIFAAPKYHPRSQPGLLRPLSAAELSDGTLRYLLWAAALMTPRRRRSWC